MSLPLKRYAVLKVVGQRDEEQFQQQHSQDNLAENWREIRTIHKEYAFFYKVLGGLILLLTGVALGGILFAYDSGYLVNLYTDLLSITATVFVIDLLARRREAKREERQLKARLIREVRGQSNDAAKRAVDELRENGWLEGDKALLKEMYLTFTNLEGVDFGGANLSGTYFVGANLKGANFAGANLKGVQLIGANLEEAWLVTADLQEAWLEQSKLRGANMKWANLEGVKWGDELNPNEVDETTILPDGGNWKSSIDMDRFTNPTHPQFWRPTVERIDDGSGVIPAWFSHYPQP